MPTFPAIWEKISNYAQAAGREPGLIAKAGLNFLAIDEDKARAVRVCEAYFQRYYGRAPSNIASHMVVGPPADCAERIAQLFELGLGTLILGLIIPDLEQVDTLATKILPQLKGALP
jgi:alkanesulfonate monooxygenase SsuD/methylene tetrahydromethanopterin reductase-like flavin-dependent oxidoreductase (luciferase family)